MRAEVDVRGFSTRRLARAFDVPLWLVDMNEPMPLPEREQRWEDDGGAGRGGDRLEGDDG